MKAGIIALLTVSLLPAADTERLALVKKAKWAFDQAILSAQPQLVETGSCIQAQAALLPVAMREELPVVHYRRGYCLMMSAAVTGNTAGFRDAASAFDQAMSTWPSRNKPVKGKAPEVGPSVLMVLSAIARLDAGSDLPERENATGPGSLAVQEDLSVGTARNTCSPDLMTSAACAGVFRTGNEWLGWQVMQHGDYRDAARILADLPDSYWFQWVEGKQAFERGKYTDAAIKFGAAVELWRNNQARWRANWVARLGPQPHMAAALADLGGARMLAGDKAQAISTLDLAIAADPQNARAYYFRARAKELAGAADTALADYNLASRAAAAGLASGESHFYRAMLLYRRRDFQRAEDEFDNALNADIGKELRPDATAWRYLAAVANGGCGASRERLGAALGVVSPYFPKEEAKAIAASCPDTF